MSYTESQGRAIFSHKIQGKEPFEEMSMYEVQGCMGIASQVRRIVYYIHGSYTCEAKQ